MTLPDFRWMPDLLRSLRWAWVLAAAMPLVILPVEATLADEAPQRVVSMNVCTDQLAMLVADKGQLISVTSLASDPKVSALASEAKSYGVNHGLAEEIFLMKPGLVLAGTYTTRATVAMLQRLGFRVEQFAPATSFDEVRAHLRRMGRLLGHEERAEALISAMDRSLSETIKPSQRKTVALYYPNNYTSGSGTLMDDVVEHAGLSNLAGVKGIIGAAPMPLEALVVAKPDLLVLGEPYTTPALAFQNYTHPALRALMLETQQVTLPSNLTVCGGPFSAQAVALLAKAAQ